MSDAPTRPAFGREPGLPPIAFHPARDYHFKG